MVNEILNDTWLSRTKQFWKFNIGIVFFTIGFILILLQIAGTIKNEIIEPITFFIIVFAFLWLLISIKCPICKKRPIYSIFRSSDIRHLNQSIVGIKYCPFCGN
jgi:hypothetical protein